MNPEDLQVSFTVDSIVVWEGFSGSVAKALQLGLVWVRAQLLLPCLTAHLLGGRTGCCPVDILPLVLFWG